MQSSLSRSPLQSPSRPGLSSDRPSGTYGVNVRTEVNVSQSLAFSSGFLLENVLLAAEYQFEWAYFY